MRPSLEDAVPHPRPLTRSRSHSVAGVDRHRLVTSLFEASEVASEEVEGSGFVIAPDLRSVNVGHAGPSELPPRRPPRAANNPLAYLDALWTSTGDCSNNGPLLNRYCLPEPNVSEEYARPNLQANAPSREDAVATNDAYNWIGGDAGHGVDEGDRDENAAVVNPAVTITGEILVCSRVSMKLNCMAWGGECLPNPCPYAVGEAVEIVRDVDDVVKEYAVNFGDYFGVQVIEAADCKKVVVAAEAKPLAPGVSIVRNDAPVPEV